MGFKIYRRVKTKKKKILAGGENKYIEAQHLKGKLTVWQRLNYLFDKNSFQEIGAMVESRINDFGMDNKKIPGDGVVTGFGTINGKLIYIAAEDFAVMGVEDAVDIVYKHELESVTKKDVIREEKIKEYNENFMSPYYAAKLGFIDEVIFPEETRNKIKFAFNSLKSKERNYLSYVHGNMPL